jgi:hypothetical protein
MLARSSAALFSVLLLAVAVGFWLPSLSSELQKLAARTASPTYAVQLASYQRFVPFLQRQAETAGHKLRVRFTPSLFPPPESPAYDAREFWGPFVLWDEAPDVIVFGKVDTPQGPATPVDSPEYQQYRTAQDGYRRHVATAGPFCQVAPCYERAATLPDGGEILVLVKK